LGFPTWLVNSPEWLVNSPEWLVNSPEWLVNSPERLVNSPEWLVNSPERLVNSPERLVNSPEWLVKPTVLMVKPPAWLLDFTIGCLIKFFTFALFIIAHVTRTKQKPLFQPTMVQPPTVKILPNIKTILIIFIPTIRYISKFFFLRICPCLKNYFIPFYA
jgi:hypothetical protein